MLGAKQAPWELHGGLKRWENLEARHVLVQRRCVWLFSRFVYLGLRFLCNSFISTSTSHFSKEASLSISMEAITCLYRHWLEEGGEQRWICHNTTAFIHTCQTQYNLIKWRKGEQVGSEFSALSRTRWFMLYKFKMRSHHLLKLLKSAFRVETVHSKKDGVELGT